MDTTYRIEGLDGKGFKSGETLDSLLALAKSDGPDAIDKLVEEAKDLGEPAAEKVAELGLGLTGDDKKDADLLVAMGKAGALAARSAERLDTLEGVASKMAADQLSSLIGDSEGGPSGEGYADDDDAAFFG